MITSFFLGGGDQQKIPEIFTPIFCDVSEKVVSATSDFVKKKSVLKFLNR